jgi:hypothetical protein
MPVSCEIDKVVENLQKAAKSPINEKALAEALFDYFEAKENCSDALLYQFGLPQNKILLEKVAGIKKKDVWEKAVCNRAEKYIVEAWNPDVKHKDRRKLIDDAIRLIKRLREERKAQGKDIKSETLTTLANAYLRRSQIIRPKGITIPEKKKEAIKEGIKAAEEAIKQAKNENAYRCRAMLYVEKERILEDDEREPEKTRIWEALEDALNNGCTRFTHLEEDVKIAVLYSELSGDIKYLEQIVGSPIQNIELEKARAYRLQNNNDKLQEEIKNLINNRLNNKNKKSFTPFSSPIWDDTVRFFIQLYEDYKANKGSDIWKQMSSDVCDACQYIEENTPSTLHIRWYWSRMRNLYDLAFLAVEDTDKNKKCKQRAEIADSLKSRPAIKWDVLEELAKGDEWLKELYEGEAATFTRRLYS